MLYIITLISLIGIIYGAHYLIEGSTSIAYKYKIPNFIIGALIVGVGTSLPELTVSLLGSIQNNSDIAIGNIVGSNIFNILGILGLTSIIFPIIITEHNKFDLQYCLGLSLILPLLILINPSKSLGFTEGFFLVISFSIYILVSFLRSTNCDAIQYNEESLWKSILRVSLGLIILIISCDFFVDSSIQIAYNFGLTDSAIALTLVACGTSLPELAASLVAAFKKNTQMALGNIVGSNIFNISFILGVCSQVSPLESSNIGVVDYSIMILAILILLICGLFKKISRKAGIIMTLIFIGYTIYTLNF